VVRRTFVVQTKIFAVVLISSGHELAGLPRTLKEKCHRSVERDHLLAIVLAADCFGRSLKRRPEKSRKEFEI